MQQPQTTGSLDVAQSDRINEICTMIKWYTRESVQEASALKNQLVTHRMSLAEELMLLQQIASTSTCDKNIDEKIDPVNLRTLLRKHYARNPLPSRGEALKAMKNIEASQKGTPHKSGNLSGIKLVLKLRQPNIKKEKRAVNKPLIKKPLIKKPKETKIIKLTPPAQTVQEDHELYCFCRQESFGDMIACDNDKCSNGEWFHYRCVGLRNRVEALKFTTGKQAWFCLDECRAIPEKNNKKSPKSKTQAKKSFTTRKAPLRVSLRRK